MKRLSAHCRPVQPLRRHAAWLVAGLLLANGCPANRALTVEDRIERLLSEKKSPLRGMGREFVSQGDRHDIDPRLAVAIAGQESSFGLKTCGKFNAWNWFWCYARGTCQGQPCRNSPFQNWGEGIQTVDKFLRRSYLDRGYTTIEQIQAKYCVDNCESWVHGVTFFYRDRLAGDVHRLSRR